MSVRLNQPVTSGAYSGNTPYGLPPGPPVWGGEPPLEPEGIPWGRYAAAFKRHTLMILVIVLIGSGLGVLAVRRVKPVYDAQVTVWITPGVSAQSGPIRAQQLLPPTSWVELLRSFAIVDPVVRKLRLNVTYKEPGDSIFFREFESTELLRPGSYLLKMERGGHYLLSTANGVAVERGALGDSIGRKVGFRWAPERELLARRQTLIFWVATPRATSAGLLSRLHTSLPDDGQFLTISLSGSDPVRTTNTLNEWAAQFVASSGELKKRHLLEFKKILGDQLSVAEHELRTSEIQLEQFRVNTITLPSDGAPVAGGVQATRDPVIANYFQQKQTLSDVRSERIALEQLIANTNGGVLDPQAFLTLPSVLNGAPQLRAAIEEFSSRQAALRTEQQFLTDANPRIKQLREGIRVLQQETIPQIAAGILQSLRRSEQSMNTRVETDSRELRAIPSRTIEEMRLLRQVSASENLYGVLKGRYEEVSLAEAQTTPDLSILDVALPPMHPNSNDAPRLLLLAVLASFGTAAGVSILHDRFDRRFRYPEQVTHELGLTISGTVPRFRPDRHGAFQVEIMSQAVESFRTLRLAIRYEFPPDAPVVLTVSSPNSGDGKSLVSSNLALAFASAGHRTLLIDGDMRRGALHGTFDVPVTPGLVEYLCERVELDAILKSTASKNLFLLPRGTRRNRAPELLLSDEMAALVKAARGDFEVVIIDSPPFSAGVDAYALGAAAGAVLVVLRPGASDRKLAAAKLEVLDRLPVRILGAVLNGVPAGGLYRYYGTDYTYPGGSKTDPVGNVATPRGLVLRA
jgi:polysaccharide biosynthesis transport protein